MRKVFEAEKIEEIYKIQKKLSDSFFESEIKESSNKYELYVDENIYEDVLLKLDIEKEEIKKKINPYKKGSFLYVVEQFFQIKYYKLVLFSFIYSLILEIIPFFKFLKKIKENGMDVEFLEILVLPFLLSFIISQLIILSTRFYQVISEIKNVFIIRINGEKNYSKKNYKILNFIIGVLLHLAYMVFIVIVLLG